ncbi:MAG: hypothetical protein ABIE94_02850 [archaeon]
MAMDNILVVEDIPEFQLAAATFFGENHLKADIVDDYAGARIYFRAKRPDGVITDIFFPYKAGSEDRRYGEEALAKLKTSDPYERKAQEIIGELSPYVTMDDDLIKLIRVFSRLEVGEDKEYEPGFEPRSSPVIGALRRSVAYIHTDASTQKMREYFEKYRQHEDLIKKVNHTQERYEALAFAIEENETQQPLGILVAETAEKMGLPFVLASSLFHHGDLVQKICEYQRRNGWPEIVDTNSGHTKDQPGFWGEAYLRLCKEANPGPEPDILSMA